MTIIRYGAQARVPTLPRLKPVVVAVPVSGNRVALRRGTNPVEDLLVYDESGVSAQRVLALLDGTRDVAAITEVLCAEGCVANATAVARFIADLDAEGLVEDAAGDSDGGLTNSQLQRYSRNLNSWAATILDGRTPARVQGELLQGHVLVVGVGGLGSAVTQGLAMAGCGTLTLVDFDQAEVENLQRQCLYDSLDIGKAKLEVARDRIAQINPDVTTALWPVRVTSSDQAASLVREISPDVVVGGADRPAVAIDRWLTDACFKVGIPYVAGAVSGAMGRVWTKLPGRACFNCDQMWTRELASVQYEVATWREEADLLPATSALSFGVQILGGLMGYDVLHHLLGLPLATAGKIMALDFSTFSMTTSDRPPHPNCEWCR